MMSDCSGGVSALRFIGSIRWLAHFINWPDLDLRNHDTHDPTNVCVTFVIGFKGNIGFGLVTARPPNLEPGALK